MACSHSRSRGLSFNAEHRERIRQTKSPMIAARLGRSRNTPLRPDWESVKVEMMRTDGRAKFAQHDDLCALLLGTGAAILVEHTENDRFWGDGGDGRGRNILGRILMDVREDSGRGGPMNPLVETWRRIIVGPEKSWVLFRHGTCVVLMQPEADLAAQVVDLLREWGSVVPASSAGDFSTVELPDGLGWVVTCRHPDVLTYVDPDEVGSDPASDLIVGLIGRSKRDQDARELVVLHVEDRRS